MANSKRKKAADQAPVIDIPHEEIKMDFNNRSSETVTAMIVLSPEQKAQQEIARFDVNREKILEVKEKFKDLSIAGIDDTAGYKAVEKAWQGLRNMRLAVEKKHKEVKADYLTITKAIDGHKNELVELIQEDGGEKHFGEMLEDIDKQKEELKNKKEREDQERLQGRVNELLANGMAFNGSFYAIGEAITMDVVSIKNMDDSAYNGLLSRVKELNAAIIAEKEKKEREEKEQRLAVRTRLLFAMGFKAESGYWNHPINEGGTMISKEAVEGWEDARFNIKIQSLEENIKAHKERLEDEAKKKRTAMRGKMLERIGMSYDRVIQEWVFDSADCGAYSIPVNWVENGVDEAFYDQVEKAEAEIAKIKKAQAEKDAEEEEKKKKAAEQAAIVLLRTEQIIRQFGMIPDKQGGHSRAWKFSDKEAYAIRITNDYIQDASEKDWNQTIAELTDSYNRVTGREKEVLAEREAEAEKARLAALSDVQRVREWIVAVMNVVVNGPTIEAKEVKQSHDFYVDSLNSTLNNYLNDLTDFEK